MDEPLSSIECPVCGSGMVKGKMPFSIDRVFVDFYKAWRCTSCGNSFFITEERDIRIRDATILGIIQSESVQEELVYKSDETNHQDIEVSTDVPKIISLPREFKKDKEQLSDNFSEVTAIVS
ncbi:hypothetical protein IX51_03755 [uncultured archaeon]|nr:hypothetical protein IX51_03755 [uncultured archaeon]